MGIIYACWYLILKGKYMEWAEYWKNLVEKKKLSSKLKELDAVDDIRGNCLHTEEICHKIYNDYYNEWKPHLEQVRKDFLELIDRFQGIHLQTSRIKAIDSLLVKVVSKRYEHLGDEDNLYSKINGDNYKDIITDLIGMRLIINYRGKWNVIHEEIVKQFPYQDEGLYEQYGIIPINMITGNALAEIPIVYHAVGDKIEKYKTYLMIPKQHNKGYRSIHYIVEFQRVYIEIQVRTIYDEAWSDCDHSYVYKQDENKSHTALEKLSQILCQLTNISNDVGESMCEIFEQERMVDQHDGTWKTTQECLDSFDESLERVEKAYNELKEFRNRLTV